MREVDTMYVVYAAGGFFNEKQLRTMELVESVLSEFPQFRIFKPRDGASAAKKLNRDIGAGKDPSRDTRHQVFRDNVDNIDNAALVVAVTDDRDVGTIFEIGYAYKGNVPIITFTNEGYGQNLMLAESVLAHCKGPEQLREACALFIEQMTETGMLGEDVFEERFKRANLTEMSADKKLQIYKEKDA